VPGGGLVLLPVIDPKYVCSLVSVMREPKHNKPRRFLFRFVYMEIWRLSYFVCHSRRESAVIGALDLKGNRSSGLVLGL